MSNLEVSMQLNRDKRTDRAQVNRFFNLAIADMSICAGERRISNLGKTFFKIKASDVTGVHIGTQLTIVFRPRDKFMRIQIYRDPAGPAGAAVVAGKLAERLAAAYHLQLSESTFGSKKYADCVADFRAQGYGNVLQKVSIVYTP
jgi:hypothetical protein